MKIFIPSMGPCLNDLIDPRFGRAGYHILYNQEDDTYASYKNHFKDSHELAGTNLAILIINLGIKVVFAVNIGKNVIDILSGAGVEIYKMPENMTVKNALEAYKKRGFEKPKPILTNRDYHLTFRN